MPPRQTLLESSDTHMRLILVRHGESKHTFQNKIAGIAACDGTTERGFEQMRALGQYWKETDRFSSEVRLLSSPVRRAHEAAEVLMETVPTEDVLIDHDLQELDWGKADGMMWDEYRDNYGAFDLVTEPDRHVAPGGESWNSFLARVRRTLQRLAQLPDDETVIAVTHAGFIVASILATFDIPRPGTRARLEPDFASVTEWRVQNRVWTLARYNHTCRL